MGEKTTQRLNLRRGGIPVLLLAVFLIVFQGACFCAALCAAPLGAALSGPVMHNECVGENAGHHSALCRAKDASGRVAPVRRLSGGSQAVPSVVPGALERLSGVLAARGAVPMRGAPAACGGLYLLTCRLRC